MSTGSYIGVVGLAALAYVYYSVCLMAIAQKTGTENGWMAWVPILNLLLMVRIAGRPGWWLLLFFIPLLNIVIAAIVWMDIAVARHKPGWWGILILVPFLNALVPGYLAFSR